MKKIVTRLLVILPLAFLAVSVASCNDEEEYMDLTTPFAKYKGAWEGSFSGTDSGTWEMTVDGNGAIIGSVKSNTLPETNFELAGKVNIDGDVTVNYIYADRKIGSFIGKMTEISASGNWDSSTAAGDWSGTWTGAKLQ